MKFQVKQSLFLGVTLSGRAFRCNLLFVPHKRISAAIPNASRIVKASSVLSICLIFFASIFVSSQETRKTLRGSVQYSIQDGNFENIKITNLNTQQTAYTNILGQFQIPANAYDEILVENELIYEEYHTVTSKEFQLGYFLLTIELIEFNVAAVNVFSITGNLELDSNKIKYTNPSDSILTQIGIPLGRERKKLDTLSYTPEFSFSLDGIGDALTGKLKKEKALYKYSQREKTKREIREYFGDVYFMDSLNIKKEEISSFLDMMYEKENLKNKIKNNDYFDIISSIEKQKDSLQKPSLHKSE